VRTILEAVGVIAAYAGAVVYITWPLAASIRTSLPSPTFTCTFDLLYSTWVLAHDTRALTGAVSLGAANIYHPAPQALFYGPAALGALPVFAPTFLATGNPTLAMNVTFLLGLALTAAVMHLVVQRWTGSHLAGVVGGSVLMLNGWLLRDFVPSAAHWSALYWFPVIAYLAAKGCDSTPAALRLAAVIALQCLTDIVYLAPTVLAPLGILVALRLTRRECRASAVRLGLAVTLALVALLPVLHGYTSVRAANPNLEQQSVWATAAVVGELPARFPGSTGPFVVPTAAIVLILAGGLAAAWRRARLSRPPVPGGWVHGVLWTVVGATLSVGRSMWVGSQVYAAPLGYFVRWVPALDAIRVAPRMGVGGLVGLAILCGVAFGEVAALVRSRLRRRGPAIVASTALAALAALFVGLVAQAHGLTDSKPYRLQAAPTPPPSFLWILRASRGPLLEAPLDPAHVADPVPHANAMYHSIAYWRPLLNGYSSYWPAGFLERMQDVARLPEATALDHLVATTGLRMIWLHTRWMPPDTVHAWLTPPTGGASALQLVAKDGPEYLFAVVPAQRGDRDAQRWASGVTPDASPPPASAFRATTAPAGTPGKRGRAARCAGADSSSCREGSAHGTPSRRSPTA
jgi:hypothetical protein